MKLWTWSIAWLSLCFIISAKDITIKPNVRELRVEDGAEQKIDCSVTSSNQSKPDLQWNGPEGAEHKEAYSHTPNADGTATFHLTLIFWSFSRADAGKYTCTHKISPTGSEQSEITLELQNKCGYGKYGKDCSLTCNTHCKTNMDDVSASPCYIFNGICRFGCEDGYEGDFCERECASGKYGHDCSLRCNTHCMTNKKDISESPCYNENGTCRFGCEGGYEGDFCDKEKTITSGHIAAIVVSVVVVIIIIIIVTICIAHHCPNKCPCLSCLARKPDISKKGKSPKNRDQRKEAEPETSGKTDASGAKRDGASHEMVPLMNKSQDDNEETNTENGTEAVSELEVISTSTDNHHNTLTTEDEQPERTGSLASASTDTTNNPSKQGEGSAQSSVQNPDLHSSRVSDTRAADNTPSNADVHYNQTEVVDGDLFDTSVEQAGATASMTTNIPSSDNTPTTQQMMQYVDLLNKVIRDKDTMISNLNDTIRENSRQHERQLGDFRDNLADMRTQRDKLSTKQSTEIESLKNDVKRHEDDKKAYVENKKDLEEQLQIYKERVEQFELEQDKDRQKDRKQNTRPRAAAPNRYSDDVAVPEALNFDLKEEDPGPHSSDQSLGGAGS